MPSSDRSPRDLYGDALTPETVVRIQRHERDFLTVSNATVQDERLTWAARGLLVYLLSLPPDWEIRVSHLQKQGGAGRDVVRRLLRELQEHGYASGVGRESQDRGERGRFGPTEIRVYESPSLNPFFAEEDAPWTEFQSTAARPATASPSTAPPSPENPSAYKEQNPQRTDGTKTHTQTPLALAPAAAPTPTPADGSVCVCSTKHGSKLCDEERISIARRTMPTLREPESYAMSREVRAGRDDALLIQKRDSLAPEEVRRSLTPQPRSAGLTYREAHLRVRSVVQSGRHGSDPRAEIERMHSSGEIDEQTRGLLLLHDWSAEAGGAAKGAAA